MTTRRRSLLAAAALAAAVAPAWGAKPYRRAVPPAELPEWVRAAAATPTPVTDADSVVLHDETWVKPLPEGGVRVVRRLAVRPLKITAIEAVWEFDLEYRKPDRAPEIRSWTVAPDGRSATRPDDVLDRRDDPRSEAGILVDDARVLSISAANPIVGSTVAYETSVVEQLDLGAEVHRFGREFVPSLRSRLTLEVPEGWGAAYSASGFHDIPCSQTATSIVCEAAEVPPLPRDEARPSAADALARVWVRWWSPEGERGFRDWNAAGRWYAALAEPVLADAAAVAEVAERFRPATPDGLATSIERLFAWAAREVRYTAIHLGIGGYRPHPPSLVASRSYGDCKDKAFLLRAVLERWGLRTHSVLVKTRDHGLVDPDVPTPAQFNHLIAAVVLPDGALEDRWPIATIDGIGRVLLLDATARESDAWTLRDDDQRTLGCLVTRDGARLFPIPVRPPEAALEERELDAVVIPSGTLSSATVVETLHAAAAANLRFSWSLLPELERRQRQEEWLQGRFPGSRLLDYVVAGLDDPGKPVVERSTVAGGWFGRRVGALLIVSPGRVGAGLFATTLPPNAPWGMRTLPGEERVRSTIRVPAGWTPEELPEPVRVRAHGIEGSAAWSFDDGALRYERTARVTVHDVDAKDYAAFREAVRRLDLADATAVAFVRESR